MSTLFEVSAADVAATSDDYYTPRWIFDAARLVFDLDVAAPVDPSRRTCPADRYLTPIEDGLLQPWEGIVWMNPPYSKPGRWVERFAAHGCGLALLPAARDTGWLGTLLASADALALISIHFHKPDGSLASARYLHILAARGEACVSAIGRIAAADKYTRGAYHVRPT